MKSFEIQLFSITKRALNLNKVFSIKKNMLNTISFEIFLNESLKLQVYIIFITSKL